MLFHSKFYFENQMWWIKRYARKSIFDVCMVWIEKSVTRDHCSASLGKPRDADQWPSWQIFLSTPYTHERYLYSLPIESHKIINFTFGTIGKFIFGVPANRKKRTTAMKIAELANRVDLDEVAHFEPPHLDLNCLPSSIWILNNI